MTSHNKRNLLIIHQGALGDFILTIPALLKLKRIYRRIDAICQNKLGKLAEYLKIIDKSFPLEAAAFASLFTDATDARIQDRLVTYHTIMLFSFSRQLEHSIRNSTCRQIYRIPPRPAPEQKIHVAEHIVSNLITIRAIPQEMEKENTIFPTKSYIDQRNPDHESSKIYIHPGSGSPLKNWPLPNFMKIYETLTSRGLHPVFILGPAEEEFIEHLKGSQWTTHIVSDLVKLAGLLKTAGGFIGNDSGVSHLAAFLGLPTAAIFGPSNPIRWQPVGKTVWVVASDIDCDHCFETHPNTCKTIDCLNNISPQKVMDAFWKIYR